MRPHANDAVTAIALAPWTDRRVQRAQARYQMMNERTSPQTACWATIRDAERAALARAAIERMRLQLDAQEAEAVATRHALTRQARRHELEHRVRADRNA